tara:strand:+ start:240 stop:776 length:537 start_codon:yes stop_codon:yes gene_type:complete
MAGDIRDFEIEGMSIGDSLLDYFNKNKILQNKMDYYINDNFITSDLSKIINSTLYDSIQISFKNNSILNIYEIEAAIIFNNKMDACEKKRKLIFEEILKSFPNADKTDLIKTKLSFDKTGNSIVFGRQIYLKNRDYIQVACFDFSNELNSNKYLDTLKVTLTSRKFADWRSKSYKIIK